MKRGISTIIFQFALSLSLFLLLITNVSAQKNAVETSGDVIYYATKQLAFSAVMAVGTSYILKHTIRKKRPDGSDHHAFPSGHATITFQGASFLQRRYGWKFGVPAYLLSIYVAWGRTFCDKHDWWDILGGAAIGIGSSYIFTKPYDRTRITLTPTVLQKSPGIHACITF